MPSVGELHRVLRALPYRQPGHVNRCGGEGSVPLDDAAAVLIVLEQVGCRLVAATVAKAAVPVDPDLHRATPPGGKTGGRLSIPAVADGHVT